MQPISTAELLQLWESGQGQPPVRRSLALLSAACPGCSLSELTLLPIGQRDALLLELRGRMFGQRLTVMARCPQCEEKLELDLAIRELLSDNEGLIMARSVSDSSLPQVQSRPLTVSFGDWRVSFRLPASQDLLDLSPPGVGDPRTQLLIRCLLFAWQNEQPRGPQDLPEEVISQVLTSMAEADPLAEIRLALTCPACAHTWKPILDPLRYFWEEIGSWAAGILQEVHLLARVYGWGESEILALSPWRRRAYLDLAYL